MIDLFIVRVIDEGNKLFALREELMRSAAVAHPSQFVFFVGDAEVNTSLAELNRLVLKKRALTNGIVEGLNVSGINEEEPVQIMRVNF